MGSTTPRFVHGVNVSRDGLVYASDRSHSMLYVHRTDGTFVAEAKLPGPFNSVAFSPDPEQHYLYAGGMNATARIFILRRSDLQTLGSFSSSGQHYMDTDSQGNLYTCGQRMPSGGCCSSCRRGREALLEAANRCERRFVGSVSSSSCWSRRIRGGAAGRARL